MYIQNKTIKRKGKAYFEQKHYQKLDNDYMYHDKYNLRAKMSLINDKFLK